MSNIDLLHAGCVVAETEALGEQDYWNTLAVMIYELGAMSQNLIMTKTQDDARGLFANAIVELADLTTQCGIMLEKILVNNGSLKWRPSFEELVYFGAARQKERMEAYIAKEPRQPSINEG